MNSRASAAAVPISLSFAANFNPSSRSSFLFHPPPTPSSRLSIYLVAFHMEFTRLACTLGEKKKGVQASVSEGCRSKEGEEGGRNSFLFAYCLSLFIRELPFDTGVICIQKLAGNHRRDLLPSFLPASLTATSNRNYLPTIPQDQDFRRLS